MMMIDFLLGIAVGGLGIWGFMRGQVARIEAEIAATTTRKRKKAAAAPPVKTRKIGEGPQGTPRSKPAKEKAEPAPKAEPTDPKSDPKPEADSDAQADAGISEAEEVPTKASEPAEKKAEKAPKKPLLNLKLPEPSSAVDDSEE